MKKVLSLIAILFSFALTSCEGGENSGEGTGSDGPDTPPTGEAVLTVNKSRIFNNGKDEAIFTVTCHGVDVTADATLYQVGAGVAMEGSTFTSYTNGDFEFYANYSNINTNRVSISAGPSVGDVPADPNESSTKFKSRVLLTQFTGTTCPYCPYAISAIDGVLADADLSSKVEHVAIHSYSSEDPMYNLSSVHFRQAMSVSAYPVIHLNMDKSICSSGLSSTDKYYDHLYTLINSIYDSTPAAGVCATTSIKASILSANIEVKAADAGEYRVGMFLLESGILATQYKKNANGSITTEDIEHINVFRDSAKRATSYDFSGTSVGELQKGEKGSAVVDLNLDSDWNLDNCHLLIYVTSKSGDSDLYSVQNVVRCEVGGEVEYQYL